MTCDSVREKILDGYDAGTLDGDVAAHLEGCDECRSWNESLKEVGASIATLTAQPLPDDFAHHTAILAQEEAGKGWRASFRAISERVLTLAFGKGTTPANESFIRISLFWSLLFAGVSVATMLLMMYIGQCQSLGECTCTPSVVNMPVFKSFLWMPMTRAIGWKEGINLYLLIYFLSLVAFIIVLARALNLRMMWNAIKSPGRIGAIALSLPLLGIICGSFLWNLVILLADLSGSLSYPYFSMNPDAVYIPHCFDYWPSFQLGESLILLNSLYFPYFGWIICAAALYLLFTRCSKGIPSLIFYFYGCLGAAVLMYMLSQGNRFSFVGGSLKTIWTIGTMGIMSLKSFELAGIAIVAGLGFLTGALMSLLRYGSLPSAREFMVKRLLPVAGLTLAALSLVYLFASPPMRQAVSLRNEMTQFCSRADNKEKEPLETHTIVVLTSNPAEDNHKDFPGNKTYFSFPQQLSNRKAIEEAGRTIEEKPFGVSTFGAFDLMMAGAISRWDQKSLLDLGLKWLEKSPICYPLPLWGFGNLLNGMTKPESISLLDDLRNKDLLSTDTPLYRLYGNYGEWKKAEESFPGISEKERQDISQKAANVSGRIKGTLFVNGKPAKNLTVRIFQPTGARMFYDGNSILDWEEDFLYQIHDALRTEESRCSGRKFMTTLRLLWDRLPFITQTTDEKGRFEFDNLYPGSYYMALRFSEKLDRVTPKTGVGIINITKDENTRDLGVIQIVEEGRK